MNIVDASAVLTYASAGDNRTVTREAALIWAEALDAEMTVDEARRAIVSHFGNSTEYLSPAHVNTIVRAERLVRTRDLPPVTPPRDLADDPRREIDWCRAWGDAVIAGHTETAARNIANVQFDVTESEPPKAIEAHVRTLRETLDRTQREMADKQRMVEIQAEVDRRAKVARRAEQAEAEKARTAERKDEPKREIRDPAEVIAEHTSQPEEQAS